MPPRLLESTPVRLGCAAMAVAALIAPATLSGQPVALKEVRPDRVRLIAGEGAASVTLRGSGLDAVFDAWVRRSGRPVRDVVVRVRPMSPGEVRIALVADPAASAFRGDLVLVSRDGTRTAVPGLSVEVVAPTGFAPRRVTTASLLFSGLRFEPGGTTTPSLVFTGLHFEPRRNATPSLIFTGLSFQPRRATTPSLVFVGNGSPAQENPS